MMDSKKIKEILDLHEKYLIGDSDGVRADLSSADLRSADLLYADLLYANLSSANLRSAQYSILNVMRSNWGTLSDSLCLEMMRWDAISCGDEAMQVWVESGDCPFINSEREFYFSENKKLWVSGKPQMNHKELFVALCKEKNIKI
jgi:hypothetical protein